MCALNAADIVSRRQRGRAKLVRGLHQIGELYPLIATHAGDRRFTPRVGLREVGHHALLEALLIVENVVGDAEAFGDPARVIDILASAAGALSLRGGRAIEL